MPLYRMIYFDRDQDVVGATRPDESCAGAEVVTGLSLFADGYRAEVLEGRRHVLSAWLGRRFRAAGDTLQLVCAGPISSRDFSRFDVVHGDTTPAARTAISEFAGSDRFEPGEMTPGSLLRLLDQLQRPVPVMFEPEEVVWDTHFHPPGRTSVS